jgi:hypothetical protein
LKAGEQLTICDGIWHLAMIWWSFGIAGQSIATPEMYGCHEIDDFDIGHD